MDLPSDSSSRRDAALVGRTPPGNDGVASDDAGDSVASDRWKIFGILALPWNTLALTFPVVISVNYLGKPDNGSSFAATWGASCSRAYLAISCLTSSMTRNQVISFILSVVICLFLIWQAGRL